MRRPLLRNFAIVISCIIAQASLAQIHSVENSMFWEVSGNGLQKSSYLLGSNHFMGSLFVDSLKNVNTKFDSSSILLVEVLFDSVQMLKMIGAATMKDTTLQQLLPPEWYRETEIWLNEISPYDNLSVFDQFNPVTVQLMILGILHLQIYGTTDISMDLYFQNKARSSGKEVVALETIDDQLHALFHSMPYRKQAELLIDFVRKREIAKDELIRIRQLYLKQNLSALEMNSRELYSVNELTIMLDERNERWLRGMPQIFSRGSAFVVVGALHLAGETGLVNQLRKLGYSVTPISF